MPRRIRSKQDRRQAAWEQKLRERALRDLRRTMRRKWRERLDALAEGIAPPEASDVPTNLRRRRQRV